VIGEFPVILCKIHSVTPLKRKEKRRGKLRRSIFCENMLFCFVVYFTMAFLSLKQDEMGRECSTNWEEEEDEEEEEEEECI
jgi:hypothetical protein